LSSFSEGVEKVEVRKDINVGLTYVTT